MQDDLRLMGIATRIFHGRPTDREDAEAIRQAITRFTNRIAAIEAKLAEKDALLRECGEALAEYACHGGPDLPCIRSEDQCRTECGKIAGDALAKIKDATDAD